MTVSRRDVVTGLIGGAAAGAVAGAPARAGAATLRFGPPNAFSFSTLIADARDRAGRPFAPRPSVPEALAAIDFDAMGKIVYRADAALWAGSSNLDPVEFFHLGRYARTPVTISVVEGGRARAILYSDDLFDIPADSPARRLPRGIGFAGFRVMNQGGGGDWLAFLGASYFRSAAPFDQYGLSARGLAIDSGMARPEEFPDFTDFWLGHDQDGNLVVHALLQGPSVVGAYRIAQRKTSAGLIQDVECRLFFRARVERLGVAPLTSMFWYGQADRRAAVDWRPQVHDSDGLAMWTGAGERIWRPLIDPPRVLANSFRDTDPRGFGLMQRDRTFADYQDDGAFYDRRPSLWVEPVGAWGAGSVTLVEIPTASETNDNIVAFWTPRRTIKVGDALAFHYRLHWTAEEPDPPNIGQVVATRTGVGGRPGQTHDTGSRKFVIDFAGGGLANLDRRSNVEAVVVSSEGAPISPTAYRVVGTDRWRLMFDVAIGVGKTVDMRAYLRQGRNALTETWIYQAFG
jgi:glucans biosynthesis protein